METFLARLLLTTHKDTQLLYGYVYIIMIWFCNMLYKIFTRNKYKYQVLHQAHRNVVYTYPKTPGGYFQDIPIIEYRVLYWSNSWDWWCRA